MPVTVLIAGNTSDDQSLPSNSGRQIINRMFAITIQGQAVLNVKKKSGLTGRISTRRRHLSRDVDERSGPRNQMSKSTTGRPSVDLQRACGPSADLQKACDRTVHGAQGTASAQPEAECAQRAVGNKDEGCRADHRATVRAAELVLAGTRSPWKI